MVECEGATALTNKYEFYASGRKGDSDWTGPAQTEWWVDYMNLFSTNRGCQRGTNRSLLRE